jgi:glycosyltransferase involved in cell wall biosynthesis
MEGGVGKNILFLTLVNINDINERGIYTDLLREFQKNGYSITIVCPTERRNQKPTSITETENVKILKVWTFNIQKTSIIEKGVGTLAIEYQYLRAIKKHCQQAFDLVLYSTPPITFEKVIRYVKNRDKAISYLLLKDIFPQNAVDMGMMKAGGLIHKFFRNKEKKLYAASDFIGCMSPANVAYVLYENKELSEKTVEENPNSVDLLPYLPVEKNTIRAEFGLPTNKVIAIYGGNLGKPQGLGFFMEALSAMATNEKIHFVIAGGGTEAATIKSFLEAKKHKNSTFFETLPKSTFDKLVSGADIGLIFLDKNFTIPNFPSRLLSYLENKLPVVAVTDAVCDMGAILEQYKAGHGVLSGDLIGFENLLNRYIENPYIIHLEGENGCVLLQERYTSKRSFELIEQKLQRV